MKKGKKKEGLKITRRQFLKGAAAVGIGAALPLKFGVGTAHAFAQSPQLSKWFDPTNFNAPMPLRGLGPTGIPVMSSVADPVFANTDFYKITIGEFTDQLHPQLGPTRLWGYWDGAVTTPVKRHLAGVILARRGTASRIRFTNTLPTPHIIPVDLTIPQPASQQQNRTATHLHGGLVPWISDGGPHDWFDPNGASGLSFPNGPGSVLDNITGQSMGAGQADYYYPNDQSFRLVWYHDHAWGITRLNAYAGIASAFLLQDSINDAYVVAGKIPGLGSTIPLVWQDKIFVNPATIGVGDPSWATVARTDVQSLGSLWYAHVYDPKLYRLFKGKKPLLLPNPSVVPEFFGDTMLCNGTVYPLVTVEAKRYRFLMLNACNARFLNINAFTVPTTLQDLATDPKTGFVKAGQVGVTNGPRIIQIGTEGGFLFKEVVYQDNPLNTPLPFNPATLTGNLLLGPAERADVIIDFTGLDGQDVIFYNDAPGPFPVGAPTNDYYLLNPTNPIQPAAGTGPDTRQILRIRVSGVVNDSQTLPILNPALVDPPLLSTPATPPPWVPPYPPLANPTGTTRVRRLTLNEDFDQQGRLRQLLGTDVINPLTGNYGQEYMQQPPTEVTQSGATEVWQIYNLTADTHPIHFHLVNVQVLWRQPFRLNNGRFNLSGAARGPEPDEFGWKETVKMHPGEATAVAMKFDMPAVPFNVPYSTRLTNAAGAVIPQANEFVWHCHILEHEEHDMMRPLVVTGENPWGQTIVGSVGGTATFEIYYGTAPYTIATSNNTFLPTPPTVTAKGGTFTVTVSAGTTAQNVTYTVTDSSNPSQTKTATLKIT